MQEQLSHRRSGYQRFVSGGTHSRFMSSLELDRVRLRVTLDPGHDAAHDERAHYRELFVVQPNRRRNATAGAWAGTLGFARNREPSA